MINIDRRPDELGQHIQVHVATTDDIAPSVWLNAPTRIQDMAPAVPSSVLKPSTVSVNLRHLHSDTARLAFGSSVAPTLVSEKSLVRRDVRWADSEQPSNYRGARSSKPLSDHTASKVMQECAKADAARAACMRNRLQQSNFGDKQYFAFKISLIVAILERGNEARQVVMEELQQMSSNNGWHGVLVSDLTFAERNAII